MGSPAASPSSFTKRNPVSLSDWWLTKVEPGFEGKKLGVSGYTIRKQAMRLFNSAAIVKRFDPYSLETADGTFIIIEGMINKDRTCMNGFSTEVCDRFLIGFPSVWEYYATEYFQNKSDSDQTQTAGTSYPANPDGLPIDSICNWFSSAGCSVTDDFKNELMEFLKSTTTEPIASRSLCSPIASSSTSGIRTRSGRVLASRSLPSGDQSVGRTQLTRENQKR